MIERRGAVTLKLLPTVMRHLPVSESGAPVCARNFDLVSFSSEHYFRTAGARQAMPARAAKNGSDALMSLIISYLSYNTLSIQTTSKHEQWHIQKHHNQ